MLARARWRNTMVFSIRPAARVKRRHTSHSGVRVARVGPRNELVLVDENSLQELTLDLDAALAKPNAAREGAQLARALGVAQSEAARLHPRVVVDATAGFGRESVLIASVLQEGDTVISIERHELIFEALKDAVSRIGSASVRERIQVRHGDAADLLPGLCGCVDAVYINAMFAPKRTQHSALAKKEMQFLRTLAPPADRSELRALVHAAIEARPRRVVCKRPARASELVSLLHEHGDVAFVHEMRRRSTVLDVAHVKQGEPGIRTGCARHNEKR